MGRFRDGAQEFGDRVFSGHREHFEALAGGQSPDVLFLTCSDSRIDPALITQTLPGELFVIRNAGNLIDTAADHSSEVAAIEYGVVALGVRHIVVCGHSHCGAIDAALNPHTTEQLPAVAAWLEKVGPNLDDLQRTDDPSLDNLRAARSNVAEQLGRLRSMAAVAEAEAAGRLTLHGWIYRLENGEIRELHEETGEFLTLAAFD